MKDVRLGKKLAFGFAIVLFLLAVDALTGIFSLNSVINNYQNEFKNEADVNIKAEELQSFLLQVRRSEKDFDARKDVKYIKRVNDFLDKADINITEMSKKSSFEDIKSKLKDVSREVADYRENFKDYSNKVIARGLTENDGIQGKFRTAAHNFEGSIEQINLENWMVDYLMIRRHEKDYMLRSDKKYVDNADKVLSRLEQKINSSNIRGITKNDLIKSLDVYQQGFHDLLDADAEITKTLATMKTSADRVLEHAEEINKSQIAYLAAIEQEISDSANTATQVLWIGGILAVLFGLVISRYLTKTITGPIMELTQAAETLATGDLNLEISIYQGDEVGQLAEAFRNMSDALKEKAEVADQIAAGNLSVNVKEQSNADVLGKAMVTMRDSIVNMQVNLQKTIEDQKAGNIDSRCEPAKFQGAYADLLSGVNETLDAVINPVLEGINILQEYAKGDLRKEMRQLPGKQIVLTEGLNTVRNNLKALIEEGLKLATAAQEGRLETRGNANKFDGGYREIIEGMNNIVNNILEPVNEAVGCLEELSKGNLTIEVSGDYQGDHAVMKNALNNTIDSLNDILGQVGIAVGQVSSGAQQVSDSSSAVSQGASEQASSLEETSSSMGEIGSQTKQNAENAAKANDLAASAQQAAENGNKQMQHMLEAMSSISDSSGQISKIIKVIDEIAFQTNLLALNAAVEAARAGVHGKGFAVVAEEVRNLAQRSAKAAKETTELIEGSAERVEYGSKITNETAQALGEIIERITSASDLVGEIASASKEQVQGIEQVNQALQQIDQVTQSSTANAEESASAAEELSSQSVQLQQMIQKFKLRGNGNGYDFFPLSHEEKNSREIKSKELAGTIHSPSGNGNGKGNEKRVRKTSKGKSVKNIDLDDKDFGNF